MVKKEKKVSLGQSQEGVAEAAIAVNPKPKTLNSKPCILHLEP